MQIWVSLLILLVFAKNANFVENSNDKTSFAPLPEGKPYSLTNESTNEEGQWSLHGLSNIANGIALTLRDHPPYDIIGNALSKSFGTGGKSPSISEVIDYEVPLIVLAAFSLLAAIIIPIVGLIFCCCRCKGNCGGNSDDSDLKVHPTKERIAYSVGIVICAFFLILTGSFILASSARMSNSIPHARNVWKDSFGDIEVYTGNSFKELNYIAVQEAIPTILILLQDVIVMGRDIAVPVINKGAPLFESLFQSVIECERAISQSLFLLSEVQNTVSSLVSKSNDILLELKTARKNLTAALDRCKSDSGGNAACSEIPDGNELATEANFTKVPNVTDNHKKIEDVAKTNLTSEVVKGNESIHNIPVKVQNLTANLTKDFQNFTSKIENVQDDVLKPFEDVIDELIQDSLYPVRDDVDEKYLGPDGMLTQYDKYRHVIFIFIGTLILLDALLLIIALILVLIGATRYDTPNRRSSFADWGGRLMIGAAGLFFFSAFLINLLAGILFLLGSNIAIVCEDLPNYKFLQKTIDDPKVMGEYLLAKKLFKDGSIPLTASGVLGDCSKNHAQWDVLKMDHLFNLSDLVHYKDQIPQIDVVFAELNKTVEDTTVLSGDAKTTVNDSLNAGVHEINYTQFDEQVKKPIVSVPLNPFASNVTKAADAVKAASQIASDQLMNTANRLENMENTAVNSAKQQAIKLGQLTSQLQQQGNAILVSGKNVMIGLKEVEHFLENEALAIAARGVSKNWDIVFGDVDSFLDLIVRQVRFDVGRCKPLSNIYHGLTSSICSHYAAGMNASWVALGLCAVVLLISIILCVRASKHFRRTAGMGVYADGDEPAPVAENVELPVMDRVADKQNLLYY